MNRLTKKVYKSIKPRLINNFQPMNLLAGDLGGTKTILAVYSNENYPKKLFEKYYISSEWKSFYSIFEDFIKHLPDHISLPEYVCIGVAGPI